jgi:hypothetical protein
MPIYLWKGPGEMEETELARSHAPELTRPISIDAPTGDAPVKAQRVECLVKGCGKRFKKPAIMARHFNSSHSELFVDKNSWRAYANEGWE